MTTVDEAPFSFGSKAMKISYAVLVIAVAVLSWEGGIANAAGIVANGTYQSASGTTTWNTGTNWDLGGTDWPSGEGAGATFNDATAARTVNMGEAITVGSISLSENTAFDNTFGAGGGSLTFDATGTGPATLSINGTAAARLTLSAPVTLNDDLNVTVQTAYTGTTGALNFTGTIGGTGGFNKSGTSKMTFGTGAKTYSGPTTFNAGWLRVSKAAAPSATSSFTVKSGATVELIASPGSYTFGTGTMFLNGTGDATFPGVIRPERDAAGRANTITNNIELTTDSLIHVQSLTREDTSHSLTLSGVVSGGGKLTQTATASNEQLGFLILTNTNTYSGGSVLNGGRLQVTGSGTFGSGDVTVNDPGAVLAAGPGQQFGISHLIISAGVANAIANNKTLSIAGGTTDDSLPSAYADLDSGINEVVGSLVLGGAAQLPGRTYGSTSSTAMVQDNNYFAGAGMVTVGLLGDYSGNNVVGAEDYVIWRKSYSSNTAMYNAWVSNFGATAGAGAGLSASVVPEPSTVALVGLLISLITLCRRRRLAKAA
jgi:fibronectin-binding autotransporter adhesin